MYPATLENKFFHLLDRCFPPGHQLHKLLNRNTVKLSYSCMPNVKQIISAHNKAVLNSIKPKPNTQNNNCNCRKERRCPLEGSCLTNNVIFGGQLAVTYGCELLYLRIFSQLSPPNFVKREMSFPRGLKSRTYHWLSRGESRSNDNVRRSHQIRKYNNSPPYVTGNMATAP